MKAVIDANIVLAALIAREGLTKELLFSPNLELVSPEFLLEEIEKYRSLIKDKTGYSEAELNLALSIILSRITIIDSTEHECMRSRARQIAPDLNDMEYFAVALKYDCILWSNDKLLKSQTEVRVLSTSELITLLS